MAFDSLSEKLQNVFKNLRSKGRLTEDDVKAALKEVKMALLEADVKFSVVKRLIADIKTKAMGQEVLKSLNPSEMVLKIVQNATKFPVKFGKKLGIQNFLIKNLLKILKTLHSLQP